MKTQAEILKDAERWAELERQCDDGATRDIFVCPPAPAAACNSAEELRWYVDAAIAERKGENNP
jgi:hypothetical protein